MEKNSRIYVAGHTGLLGSVLVRTLRERGCENIITIGHDTLDLSNQKAVSDFIKSVQPDYVFLVAALAGNIAENIAYPAEFIYQNIQIQNNVIHSSYLAGVMKLVFYGSNCCYPRLCYQPMKEEMLLTGQIELTNEAYALAKIAGLKMCQYYNYQFGTRYLGVIPASIYGPNDHFGLRRAHVLADLIYKFHQAKISGSREVVLFGSGIVRREFIYVDDVADASIFLMDNYNFEKSDNSFVNVGTGKEISVSDLALLIAKIVGYTGKISWDTSKPDGMPRKLLDSSKCHAFGWYHNTELESGIRKTYEWYLKNREIN